MHDAHYRVLKALEADPQISQRQLAKRLGISLGKTNYCIRALLDKGWVKAKAFRDGKDRRVRSYQLTAKGIEGKARLTLDFLKHKSQEFEALKEEIAELRREVRQVADSD